MPRRLIDFLGPDLRPDGGHRRAVDARSSARQVHRLEAATGSSWSTRSWRCTTSAPSTPTTRRCSTTTSRSPSRCCPNGNSRLTVEKREALRDFPMVSRRARQPFGRTALAPDLDLLRHLPQPRRADGHRRVHVPVHVARRRRRTTELELRWYAPAWQGDDVPIDHLERMALFETVMTQDTANMAPIQASVSSPGSASVPDRLARTTDPPLPARRRPRHRSRRSCPKAWRSPTPSTSSSSRPEPHLPHDCRRSSANLLDPTSRAPGAVCGEHLGVDSFGEGQAQAVRQREAFSAFPSPGRPLRILENDRLDPDLVADEQGAHQIPVATGGEHLLRDL